MQISIVYLTCSLSIGLLGWREVGPGAVGQLDTVLAALAAVMVGADRGLIHPRDHGRAKGRADRRGRAGPCESQALLRKAIDVRHLNRLPAVARKACRHVVNHELNNVELHGCVRVRSREQRPLNGQGRRHKVVAVLRDREPGGVSERMLECRRVDGRMGRPTDQLGVGSTQIG